MRDTGGDIEDNADEAADDASDDASEDAVQDAADDDRQDRRESVHRGVAASDHGRQGSGAPVLAAVATDEQAITTSATPAPSTAEPTRPAALPTDPWGMLLSLKLTAAGVGLAGPGAVAAMRGLLLDALYTDTGRRPVVVAGLPERLGIAPDQLENLGVTVVPDLAGAELAALAALSSPADTVVMLAEAPEHPAPRSTIDPINSFATADNADTGHDEGEYDGAVEVGVLRMVVLGELHNGVTAYLRTDGTIAAAGPPAGRTHLLGQRLPVVDDVAGAELLDLATASHAIPAPPDSRDEPSHIGTEPPANTRADVPAGVRADGGADTASDPEADRTEPRRGRPVWTLQILGRPALLLNRHSSVTDEPATDEPAIPDTSTHTSMPDAGDMVDVSDRVSARMFDLLVYLALHPEGARRDAVVAALWPDTGRPRPSNNLSALINRLRNALQAALNDSTHNASDHNDSDRNDSDHNDSDHNDTAAQGTGEVTALVVADGERYRLDTDRVAIDYHSYLAAVALATSEPGGDATPPGQDPARLDPSALQVLHHAQGLFRGPLADGIDDTWIASIREATRRNLFAITSRLVRHHVTTNPAAALAVLEITRNLEPTSQGVYRDIMALQLRLGDNEAAAATFQLLETQLADIDEPLDEATIALAHNLAL